MAVEDIIILAGQGKGATICAVLVIAGNGKDSFADNLTQQSKEKVKGYLNLDTLAENQNNFYLNYCQ